MKKVPLHICPYCGVTLKRTTYLLTYQHMKKCKGLQKLLGQHEIITKTEAEAILGGRVASIMNTIYSAGGYSVSFDPSDSAYCVWYGDGYLSCWKVLSEAIAECNLRYYERPSR